MSLWKFGDPVDFGEGYRELEDGEIVPKGAETFMGKKWDPVDGAVGAPYKRARKGRARYHFPIRVKEAPIEPVESKGLCGKIDPGEGYRLLNGGDRITPDTEWLLYDGSWCFEVNMIDRSRIAKPPTARMQHPRPSTVDEIEGAEYGRYNRRHRDGSQHKHAPAPKDPKTKYHRPMYPAWNDPQVHTDANGHQYLNVDVYSVLAAFDPGHEVAHAVKKLLAAGTRDKGSKIQDYREAIISIEAAIYRAEIEGGVG